MIMSDTREAAIKAAFGNLQASIQTTLLNTSVKLAGKTAKGSFFTGSGVILYPYEGETYLLSAKHNLYMYADLEEAPSDKTPSDLTAAFVTNVSIYYDGAMKFNNSPGRTAAISAITSIEPPTQGPWDYDVILLKSTDASLNFFATNNYLYTPPLLNTDLNFVLNQANYLAKGKQVLFFQTGYGDATEKADNPQETLMPLLKKGDNISGNLQYRIADPLAKATITAYQQLKTGGYAPSVNTILLAADPNDSTAPGDSGGPLFVVTYNQTSNAWVYYVIGVTMGADLAPAQQPCPGPNKLRVNGVSTSLEYCYRNNLI